jgi:hypothetical protein
VIRKYAAGRESQQTGHPRFRNAGTRTPRGAASPGLSSIQQSAQHDLLLIRELGVTNCLFRFPERGLLVFALLEQLM